MEELTENRDEQMQASRDGRAEWAEQSGLLGGQGAREGVYGATIGCQAWSHTPVPLILWPELTLTPPFDRQNRGSESLSCIGRI